MKTNAGSLIILSLLLLLTSCGTQKEPHNYEKRLIYDKAKIFNSKEYYKLDSLLKLYQRDTKCEIIVYTQEKLPFNKSGYDFSIELAKDIGIGEKGINNGALIFFSLQDRDIELRLGHGFEWLINQDTANNIIQQMIGSFKDAKFADGIFGGVKQIMKFTTSSSWEIKPEEYDSLAINDIVKEKDIKLIERGKDYLIIRTKKSTHLKLHFTKFMSSIVKDITNDATIYYRVLSSKNDEGNLLGVE